MRRETEDFMVRHGMLKKGGRILAALSGGADSVCLLYVLAGMREKWDLEVRALHVHHGLRGAEADRDQAFSESCARSLGIPFSCVQVNVRQLAAQEGLSEEEAARSLRYQALEEAACRWEMEENPAQAPEQTEEASRQPAEVPGQLAEVPKQPAEVSEQSTGVLKQTSPVQIAVAHHRDDNAETVLHHLFRGSGLRGLSGIRPVRGRIIRPLLWAGRQEIAAFLREEKVSWIEDSTNASEAYTRNRLRNQILPLICSQVNSRAPQHISQAAEFIGQADAYLEMQAARWLEDHGVKYGGGTKAGEMPKPQKTELGEMPKPQKAELGEMPNPHKTALDGRRIQADGRALSREPEIIRTYVVRQMMEETAAGMRDLSSVHVRDVLALLEKQSGSQADLPGGLCAWKEGENLILGYRGRKSGKECPSRQTEREYPGEKSGKAYPSGQTEREYPSEQSSKAYPSRQSDKGCPGGRPRKGHPNQQSGQEMPSVLCGIPPFIPGETHRLFAEAAGDGEALSLEFTAFFLEKGMNFPQKQYTKWFDYDKIQGALSVRTRQTGDYFLLPGGGRKSVKSYMIDQKIPAGIRDRILLLAEGSHVLWIIGWRISEGAKITPKTRRILQVHVSGGKENDR